MRYELYAVEVLTDTNPLTYALATRVNEGGVGSPLVWPDRAGAEKYIEAEFAPHCGDEVDAQVVPLTGETGSENDESWAQLAKTWPHARSGDAFN
jgi:hypothetical protein